MSDEDHKFNRRASDANVVALSTRVGALEGRVRTLEDDMRSNTTELKANTALTKQVHTNTETIVEIAQSAAVLMKVGKRGAVGLKYLGFAAGGITAIAALGRAGGLW